MKYYNKFNECRNNISIFTYIYICRNQPEVNSTDAPSNQVRLPSAINAADCDCSYHAKKNRSTKNEKEGESDDDDDDDSDIDDA